MGMLQPSQDCGAIIREIAGRVKRILDMPAMFVWYFKEEKWFLVFLVRAQDSCYHRGNEKSVHGNEKGATEMKETNAPVGVSDFEKNS